MAATGTTTTGSGGGPLDTSLTTTIPKATSVTAKSTHGSDERGGTTEGCAGGDCVGSGAAVGALARAGGSEGEGTVGEKECSSAPMEPIVGEGVARFSRRMGAGGAVLACGLSPVTGRLGSCVKDVSRLICRRTASHIIRTPSAVCGRSAGFFLSSCWSSRSTGSGTSGLRLRASGGGSSACLNITWLWFSAGNTTRPVTISKSMQPSA